jgi:ankyrin repeat protein
MEDKIPGPVKGYQKQIKKEETPVKPPSKPKGSYAPSPTAQKWPVLVEAIESGNVEVVKKLIEEGVNVNLSRNGVTPLMLAASKGNTEIAEVVLQAGVNINAKDDDGWTALHKAAFAQAGTAIIELLMQSGIDVAALNNSKKTALMLAEEAKHRDIVSLMKKDQQKAETDTREWKEFLNSPEGKPFKQKQLYDALASISTFIWLPPLALGVAGFLLGALFHAVVPAGVIGIVLGLLASLAGYVLQWKTGRYLDGLGPLPYLDINIVRAKHKAGEKITVGKKSRNSFAEAPAGKSSGDGASKIHREAATLVNGSDLAPAEKLASAKKPASRSGVSLSGTAAPVFAMVLLLVAGLLFMSRGPIAKWYYAKKIERTGLTFSSQAFLAEVSKNNEEAVDLFIKAGIPIDAKNDKEQTALMIAAEKGHVGILGKLAALDAALLTHADAGGNTALMNAARQGQEQSIKALIEKGADVNYVVTAYEGAATPLQAVLDVPDFTATHMSVVNYLLQQGATVTGKNDAGRFPLLFAAEHGRVDAAALLIEKGADVNSADLKGNFPLLFAAGSGNAGLVTLLLDKGAYMKMASPDGHTPLMRAAKEGRSDAVKVLLERGAVVNARAMDGSTALTAAARTGNADMVKLLLEKGADPSSGYLPDPFIGLNGKEVVLNARKSKLSDVLGRIAKTASLDGYTVAFASKPERKVNLQTKGAWNKVLAEVATQNHLSLVVKDMTVFVLPYDPAAIKHEALVAAPVATVR